MDTMEEIITYLCPACGAQQVYISPVITLLEPPYWEGVCCNQKCRYAGHLDTFLRVKLRKQVTTNTSNYLN